MIKWPANLFRRAADKLETLGRGSWPKPETQDNFRIYNAHGSAQTFDYEGWVEGD